MKVGGNCYCLKGKDYINLSLGRNGDICVNFAKMLPWMFPNDSISVTVTHHDHLGDFSNK